MNDQNIFGNSNTGSTPTPTPTDQFFQEKRKTNSFVTTKRNIQEKIFESQDIKSDLNHAKLITENQYFADECQKKQRQQSYPSFFEESDIVKASKLSSSSSSNMQKQQLVCKFHHPVKYVCRNSECNKHVMICQEDDCECKKDHELCAQIFIQGVKNKIHSKITPLTEVSEKITEQIQKTSQRIIDLRWFIDSKLSQGKETFGMAPNQKKFMTALDNADLWSFTGKEINLLVTNNPHQIDGNSIKQQYLRNSLTEWEELNKKVDHSINKMKEFIQNLKEEAQAYALPFLKQSKVLKTKEDERKIRHFFRGKKIVGAKLLFCASSYDFQIESFHQSCNGIGDTLTVCETEYEKIIGGYTPIPWSSQKQDVIDSSRQSFIFSLSNNHKFRFMDGKVAICRRSKQGPFFGNSQRPDLCI